MTEASGAQPSAVGGHVAIGVAAIASGLGYWALGEWMQPADPASKFVLAAMRTIFTLLPALVAFAVASRRQRQAEEQMAGKLDSLKKLMGNYQRLQSVESELKIMDRLAKVARNTVVSTGSSSQELFRAIEAVQSKAEKDLLLERYRNHTGSVVTVLTAVSEQLSESGRTISENVTADDKIDIIDRADKNAEDGLKYAQKIIDTRGIGDGLQQLKSSMDRAHLLQGQITTAVKQMEQPAIPAVMETSK